MRFSTQLESGVLDGQSETVNLACLFSCQGAVADALNEPWSPTRFFPRRLDNATQAADVAKSSGWQPLLAPSEFRTGILLLQAERDAKRELSAAEMRQSFSEQGVALTAYGNGILRLSMPDQQWEQGAWDFLRTALIAAA